MKKIISLIMVLALVLGLATTAFATTSAPVVIEPNAHTGNYNMLAEYLTKTVQLTIPAATEDTENPGTYEPGAANFAFDWNEIDSFNGWGVTITGEGDFVSQMGMGRIPADEGTIETVLENLSWGWSLYNNETEELTVTMTFTTPPLGSYSNPDTIELGEQELTFYANEDGYFDYYYTWTAIEGGTLTLTLDMENTFGYAIVYMEGSYGEWDNDSYDYENDVDTYSYSVKVAAGEKALVNIYSYSGSNAKVALNLSFEADEKGTMFNPIIVDEDSNFTMDVAVSDEFVWYQFMNTMGASFIIEDADAVISDVYGYERGAASDSSDENDEVLTVPNGWDENPVYGIKTVGDDTSYTLKVEWPEGAKQNPVVIDDIAEFTMLNYVDNSNVEEVYYTWTATETGALTLTSEAEWYDYVPTDADGEPLDVVYELVVYINGIEADPTALNVTKDDTVVIKAVVAVPEGYSWVQLAEISAAGAIDPAGSATNPIAVNAADGLTAAAVPAAGKVNYMFHSKLDGYTITVKGEGAYIEIGGKKFEAVNGVASASLAANGAYTAFAIGNAGSAAGAYTVTLTAPSDNPKTGDMGIILPALAMVMSACGAAFVCKKKD